jgi:hypothetical protein
MLKASSSMRLRRFTGYLRRTTLTCRGTAQIQPLVKLFETEDLLVQIERRLEVFGLVPIFETNG